MEISLKEFVIYSSPRYYRLIFEDYRPKTKNGDLVSALSELKRWKFLTYDSNWDLINLSEKGKAYKALISELLEVGALHVPQSFGLFDYRSEPGRKAIIELISFLSAKLDFNKYFRYLHIPIFENEENKEWMELFGENSPQNIDYLSVEGREQLIQFLKQRAHPHKNKSDKIQQTLSVQDTPVNLNLKLVKQFLKKNDIKRPEPLFNHFNIGEPRIFNIFERKFNVNLSELTKIDNILMKYISDYKSDDNEWLSDYFKLLKLPTGKSGLFGFKAGEDMTYASKSDAFLNLAIEGPRIFAGQFCAIKQLGELRYIMFPINPKESLVITCGDLDMIYYFTILSEDCVVKVEAKFVSLMDFPEKYISSRGQDFGALISRSRTMTEALQIQNIMGTTDPEEKKRKTLELRKTKEMIGNKVESLSYFSASLLSISQMITQKFNKEFGLMKCLCLYENGYISLEDVGGAERILTSVNLGSIEFGLELQKTMKKIESSLEEIVDIPLSKE